MTERELDNSVLSAQERFERERRLAQLDILSRAGIDPYPTDFPQRTHSISEILDASSELIDQEVTIAGRITDLRARRDTTFLDLIDSTGKIQSMVERDRVTPVTFDLARAAFTRGDIAAITGIVTRTDKGSMAVNASDLTMLSKSLLPLPSQIVSAENRHAKRHLDLLANPESRETLIARSKITRLVRSVLEEREMIEVESPIVNNFYNGGIAKPFITHHNALNEQAFMRVTSELYLKRLIVSGIDGVFEIAKQFRNEGMSGIYSPEFTVLEAYKAYESHEWMMDLMQEIIQRAALDINGRLETKWQGSQIDLSGEWPRIKMRSAVGISLGLGNDPSDKDLQTKAQELGINGSTDQILGALFKRVTEPTLIQPVFITDFPVTLSPLAKTDPEHPENVLKYMLYVGGTLVSDGNYEENDPLKQQRNLIEQERQQIENGVPQYPRDPDFMGALQQGMPPLAGAAIGIDRLTMLITGNDHIREVMAFRPRKLRRN
jgi:lysyl-tRNA synthetase class 2